MKIKRGLAVAIVVATMAVACGGDDDPAATTTTSSAPAATTSSEAATSAATSSATESAATESSATATETSSAAAPAGEKVKIALANSYIGNKWRIEMANVFKSACAMPPYKETVECPIFHSGNDVGKQTQQITNLISQGVDGIALNAASPTGLNGIVKQACDKGIVVVAFDNTVTEKCALQVNIDQKATGANSAEWLVKEMGGKGNIIMVTGVAGTSVDQDRNAGAKEVFAKNPGIKIVAEYTGMWDSATAQRNTATQLSSIKGTIDGAWVSGGTDGVLKAFKDAGKPLPPTAGESENGFRKMMAAGEVKGHSTGTPPFLSVMALEMVRAIIKGEIPKENVTIKYPEVTNDGLEEGKTVFKDQPDSFFNTFTDSGDKASVIMCIEGALTGEPCPGEAKVSLASS